MSECRFLVDRNFSKVCTSLRPRTYSSSRRFDSKQSAPLRCSVNRGIDNPLSIPLLIIPFRTGVKVCEPLSFSFTLYNESISSHGYRIPFVYLFKHGTFISPRRGSFRLGSRSGPCYDKSRRGRGVAIYRGIIDLLWIRFYNRHWSNGNFVFATVCML